MVDLEALLLRDYEIHERRSVRRARAALRHLAEHIRSVRLERAYDQTARYVQARRRELAASATIRYEVTILGRALTLAARSGMIRAKPFLARPSVQNARQGFVGAIQARALLQSLPDPIGDAALFAYVTGWRRAEVYGLTWDRVDFERGVVRLEVGTTKNLEGRTFPFGAHPGLRRMLERRRLALRGPWVFSWPHGGPVADFRRTWKRACREVGLGNTVFHDLRRSAVRNMERAGVPRSVAMKLTGHKTEAIYKRYAITNEEDLARGVRLIAEEESRSRRVGKAEPGGVVGEAPEGNRFNGRPSVPQKDG